MTGYEVTLPVRFGQVDYAGIMFYPRFFENFHTVFEDMFTSVLGVPYMSVLRDRRIGFPTVHIETDFRAPFRFGDPMRLVIEVTRLGRTSIDFRYRGYVGDADEPSVEARNTGVVLHLDTFEKLEIPADIREALERLSAD